MKREQLRRIKQRQATLDNALRKNEARRIYEVNLAIFAECRHNLIDSECSIVLEKDLSPVRARDVDNLTNGTFVMCAVCKKKAVRHRGGWRRLEL